MSVTHLVLFRPRTDLTSADRRALIAAIEAAASAIPAVRRFRVGRLLADGPSYHAGSHRDHTFCALVDVDDADGLREYLNHPAHHELGARFNATLESALIADFETTDAVDAGAWLSSDVRLGAG